MKALKALAAFVLTLTMLTGCLSNGLPTPATAQEVATQNQAMLAALTAYCTAADAGDSEVKSVCDSVLPVATGASAAVSTALALIMNIMARRSLEASKTRALAECHNDG